jgi:predicted transcriptional regulator
MENQSERKRKSKGSLSVMDEFTGDAGVIDFQPQISREDQNRIDQKTKFADIPTSARTEIMEKNPKFLKDNLGQTSDKPKTEPRTNLGQLSDKLRTNLRHNLTEKNETSDKPKTEPRTDSRTNLGQLSDKPRTISAFQSLSGLQKNIMVLFYDLCRISGGRTTAPVSIEQLYLKLKSTRLSVQKSIQRLEQKHLVLRKDFRSGRGGWTIYELPEAVWNEILQSETSDKLRTNLGQLSDKPKTEPKTEPRTTSPYSSSNNLNIITTNTGEPEFSAEITLPNNLSRFGISKNNLQKLVDDKLCSLELVQKSIEALSFDVENGKTGNLAAILFGVLRSGKEYISQKYSETLQQELDQELKRIQETENHQKRLLEIKLLKRFKDYVDQNPSFIDSIKNKHSSFVSSNELLEKVAFEEFKNLDSI